MRIIEYFVHQNLDKFIAIFTHKVGFDVSYFCSTTHILLVVYLRPGPPNDGSSHAVAIASVIVL